MNFILWNFYIFATNAYPFINHTKKGKNIKSYNFDLFNFLRCFISTACINILFHGSHLMWNEKKDASQNIIVATAFFPSLEFVTHIIQFMLMKNMDNSNVLKRIFYAWSFRMTHIIHCLISNGCYVLCVLYNSKSF